jgi:hypothetical protein
MAYYLGLLFALWTREESLFLVVSHDLPNHKPIRRSMYKPPNTIFFRLLALAFAATLYLTVIPSKTHAQQLTAGSDLQSRADKNEKVHNRIFQSFAVGTIPDILAKTTGDITYSTGDDMEEGSVRDLDTPLYPPSRLVELACATDAVVLATPVAGVSHLTADKTAIYSDWTMHVDEILQDSPKAPIVGSETISIVRPGGKLIIGGRTVTVKAVNFPEFRPDGKYLLFLTYIPETGAFKARTERTFNLALGTQSAENPHPYAHLHTADPVQSASPEQLVTDTRAAINYAAGKSYCATKKGDL